MRRAIVLCAVAAGLVAPGAAAASTPMTVAQAGRLVPETLRHEYAGEFSRRSLTRSCAPGTPPGVDCRVRWRRWPYRYAGTVTLWYAASDAAAGYATYSYSTLIARTSIRRRRPTTSRRSAP